MQEENRETPATPTQAPAPVTVQTLREYIPPIKRVLPRANAEQEDDQRLSPSPRQSGPAYERPSL